MPPAVEAGSPNHWTAREFPQVASEGVMVSSGLKMHLIRFSNKIEVFLANKKGHWLVGGAGIYC